MNTCVYLVAEVGLGQAVAVHDFDQVVQHAVEHLVQLLPHDGQRLLGRQRGRVGLHLEEHNVRDYAPRKRARRS